MSTYIDEHEQRRNNLILAFCLTAYRLENYAFPEKLDQLVPKYLNSIPDDLFSEKSPIYMRTNEGYLLYSIGNNGRDDGGQNDNERTDLDDLKIQMPQAK